jgi:phosphoglucosamine mutase
MAEPVRHPLGAPLAPGSAGFGTDGIRGRVGQLITPALALQLGFWCGRELPQGGPIVLGMDSRSSGVSMKPGCMELTRIFRPFSAQDRATDLV